MVLTNLQAKKIDIVGFVRETRRLDDEFEARVSRLPGLLNALSFDKVLSELDEPQAATEREALFAELKASNQVALLAALVPLLAAKQKTVHERLRLDKELVGVAARHGRSLEAYPMLVQSAQAGELLHAMTAQNLTVEIATLSKELRRALS